MSAIASGARRYEAPVLIVQLTDAHLMADPEATLRNINTDLSLRAVLDLIGQQSATPNLLLLTGDLSQDGSAQAYQRLRAHLAHIDYPIRCLPGNHDAPAVLGHTLSHWMNPVLDIGAWRIILLDSTVADADFGHLNSTQLALLDQALHDAGPRYVLVALHHNLIRMDGDWPDPLMVDNPQTLFERLQRHPRARVVLWGHIHQAFDCRWHHLRLLATPATCFQFALRDGKHVIDTQAPGFRWLKLYSDGSVATGVMRIPPSDWASLRAQGSNSDMAPET